MAEKGFEPLTSQLGIAGTSYRIQLGLINEKWASRILKGRDIIDSYIFKEEDTVSGLPNSNLIVGWVLRTVAIPNINPHQIMKTTQALVKQAIQKKEERKMVPTVSESREIELEKVPENELKRPTTKGWVKEEGSSGIQDSEEAKRRAFQERVKAIKEESAPQSTGSTVKTTRTLPSIPSGGGDASITTQVQKTISTAGTVFCPSCGKDIDWKFCPYCGKPLPHE
ncbi:MAG: zinc ribbon domain-containing protein [Candidatus Lokiarchaeota archaeon]|nr:zinc ribbon domain-containing protein [Candidatus Lokiarchaeota archaeon]